jgi:hypothetical protein
METQFGTHFRILPSFGLSVSLIGQALGPCQVILTELSEGT